MARIGSKDTAPEMALLRALRERGIGYRLHRKGLPGRPDVVLVGAGIAVFVHGCFWHSHRGCSKASSPKRNSRFWADKFRANEARDARNVRKLLAMGWRVGVLWECEASDPLLLGEAVDLLEQMRAESPAGSLNARNRSTGHRA